jgi:hypothetical protein
VTACEVVNAPELFERQRYLTIRRGDADVILELGVAATSADAIARFIDGIDYSRQSELPLTRADRAWARELIGAWKERTAPPGDAGP